MVCFSRFHVQHMGVMFGCPHSFGPVLYCYDTKTDTIKKRKKKIEITMHQNTACS